MGEKIDGLKEYAKDPDRFWDCKEILQKLVDIAMDGETPPIIDVENSPGTIFFLSGFQLVRMELPKGVVASDVKFAFYGKVEKVKGMVKK